MTSNFSAFILHDLLYDPPYFNPLPCHRRNWKKSQKKIRRERRQSSHHTKKGK